MLWWLGCQPSSTPHDASPPPAVATLGVALEGTYPQILPDLDGDGADDVFTQVSLADRSAGLRVEPDLLGGAPAYLLGAPSLVSTEEYYVGVTGIRTALAAGDLDGDGLGDLWMWGMDGRLYLVPGPFRADDGDVVARATGTVTLGLPVGPMDADGDGQDDLVLPSDFGLHVCPGPFAVVPDPTSCPTRAADGERPRIASTGDLDGDGSLEIVVLMDGEFLAVPGDDPSGPPLLTVSAATWVHAADLDGDGHTDLLHGRTASFGPFSAGSTVDPASGDATLPDGWDGLATVALSGPVERVIVGRFPSTTGVAAEFGIVDLSGGGAISGAAVLRLRPDGAPEGPNVGDLNADGVQDVLLSTATGQAWWFDGAAL